MIIIGLTGGVGTGKSTVADIFKQLGAVVMDADGIAHELMRKGTPVWRAVRRAFGAGISSPTGQIDRKRLGALVFNDPRKLARLCQIVHPAVRRRFRELTRAIGRTKRGATVVWDIPLLIEAGPIYKVDALVVVSAPFQVAARRLRDRSGWSSTEVKKRQSFQMPLKKKERLADFVVYNNGSLTATRRQVVHIWNQIHKEGGVNGGRKG